MLQSLLDKLRGIYTTKEDQELFDEQEKEIADMEAIRDLLNCEQGEILKNWLMDEFQAKLKALFDNRREQDISDLQSIYNLINKLSVNQELDSIEAWLKEKLE